MLFRSPASTPAAAAAGVLAGGFPRVGRADCGVTGSAPESAGGVPAKEILTYAPTAWNDFQRKEVLPMACKPKTGDKAPAKKAPAKKAPAKKK